MEARVLGQKSGKEARRNIKGFNKIKLVLEIQVKPCYFSNEKDKLRINRGNVTFCCKIKFYSPYIVIISKLN